ncbi:beta-propeller fold lactonase family protein [Sphingomonas crusticola]|uniref:beta-propeller fold lactonase family protein n=1 Tax=Sphingomonas crusticola TaxID=1697973 RepID=UPI0013C353CB|nr:beta-propeller fold lactonase family protein [Sphingomonas crusticola]
MGRSLLILSLLVLASCGRPPAASEKLFVSNERGDSVVALDPASGTVLQRISPGRRPRGLLLSPDGATLYVAISGSPIGGPGVDESRLPPADHRADGIAVIDVASGKVARVLPAGTDPETFALSPDGRTLFVSNEDQGVVSAVAVDGGRAAITTKVGNEPEGIAVTPDGARLFVACEASDHVAMLDARTLKLIKTIAIEGRPRGLLMSADGATVYASVESGGRLALISAGDGVVQKQIDLAQGDKSIKPMGMVEAPDGHVFVTTGRGGMVLEVDPMRGAIVRGIARVGARPWGIGITADRKTLLTANGPSNNVTFVDRVSGKIIRHVATGEGPWGIASRAGGGAQ